MTVETFISEGGQPVTEARLYQVVTETLTRIDRELQNIGVLVPSPLRDGYNKAHSVLRDVLTDAAGICEDLKRWDGDVDKALAERDFRKGRR
jgi:hypothetical protein